MQHCHGSVCGAVDPGFRFAQSGLRLLMKGATMAQNEFESQFTKEFERWRVEFEDWRQKVLIEMEAFGKKQDVLRQMINWTAANVMGCRMATTAVLAGVPLTDERIELLLDALAPPDRDPSGEFRSLVRNAVDDIRTTAEMWSGDKR